MRAISAAAISGVAIVALCGAVMSTAQSQKYPDLPPGVQQSDWIPMGHDVGFVITERKPSLFIRNQDRLGQLTTTAVGFFMARREGVWQRLQMEPQPPALHKVPGA